MVFCVFLWLDVKVGWKFFMVGLFVLCFLGIWFFDVNGLRRMLKDK